MKNIKKTLKNNSGFVVAEFLFAFVMVLGIGIFIFSLTFALATVEISQYIVWSAARNFSASNVTEAAAIQQATEKFNNLAAKFPLLTGVGADSPWFKLPTDSFLVGDLSIIDTEGDMQSLNSEDKLNSFRQPWIGARAILSLELFASLQVPFLGKVAETKDSFKLPVRAFLIRHPSREECLKYFYEQRYEEGIRKLEEGNLATQAGLSTTLPAADQKKSNGEDNGC